MIPVYPRLRENYVIVTNLIYAWGTTALLWFFFMHIPSPVW